MNAREFEWQCILHKSRSFDEILFIRSEFLENIGHAMGEIDTDDTHFVIRAIHFGVSDSKVPTGSELKKKTNKQTMDR